MFMYLGYYIFFLIGELLLDITRGKFDKQTNNRQTTRVSKSQENNHIKTILWNQLKPCDIVYLKKGDICPADVLLLDTSDIEDKSAICYLETKEYDGKMSIRKKKAAFLSQTMPNDVFKDKFSRYKKRLTGKLEFLPPNNIPEKFLGYLTLNKDPKSELLTIENLIPRGTIILSEWIYALVVYVGMDCKIMRNSFYQNNRKSMVEFLINKFMFVMFLLLFSFSVILYINFVLNFIPTEFEKENPLSLLEIIIMLHNMIPINIYFSVQIVAFIHKCLIENRDIKSRGVKICNYMHFSDLGQIDYVLFDKTCTLTTGDFLLDSIFTGNKNFQIEFHETDNFKKENYIFNIKKKELKKNQSMMMPFTPTKEIMIPKVNTINILPKIDIGEEKKFNFLENDINLNFGLEHQESGDPNELTSSILSQDDFIQNLNDQTISDLLQCICLTSSALKKHSTKQNQDLFNVVDIEEKLLQKFCKECKYEFKMNDSSTGHELILKDNKDNNIYNLLGINDFSYKRKRFSVLFQTTDPNDDSKTAKTNTLYCRGNAENIMEVVKLDNNKKKQIDEILRQYSKKGLRIIIFAKRNFKVSEAREFYRKFTNFKSSLVPQNEKLEKLALEMEVDLDIIGIVGLKDKLKDNATDTLKFFKEIRAKIWILTGDTYLNAFNAGINLNLINIKQEKTEENRIIHFKDVNAENLRYFIRELLRDMKKYIDYFTPFSVFDSSTKLLKGVSVEFGDLNLQVENFSIRKKEKDELQKQTSKTNTKRKKNRKIDNTYLTVFKNEAHEYFSQRVIMVSGETLDLILKDSYLRPHFIFIAALFHSLIGYNLNPDHKEKLARIIRKNFYNNPTILSIGDGYNDIPMFKASDISIEVLHKNSYGKGIGNIEIQNLDQIKELILNDGHTALDSLIFIIKIRFFQSSLLIFGEICLHYLYEIYRPYFLFKYDEVFFYFSIISLIDIFFIGINNKEKKINDKKSNSIKKYLYLKENNKYKGKVFLPTNFFFLITICIITCSTSFFIIKEINIEKTDLRSYNLFVYSSFVFYHLLLISQTKTFFIYSAAKAKTILPFLHFISLIIVTLGLIYISNDDFIYLLKHSDNAFIFLFFSLLLNLFFYIFLSFIQKNLKRVFQILDHFIFNRILKLSKTLHKDKNTIEISNMIQKIFSDNKHLMDQKLKEMINPEDIGVNELTFNKYSLQITEQILEMKFRYSRISTNVKKAKILFVICFLLHSVLIIKEFFDDSNDNFANIIMLIACLIVLGLEIFIFSDKFLTFYYYSSTILIIGLIVGKIIVLLITLLSAQKDMDIIYTVIFLTSVFNFNHSINFLIIFLINFVLLLAFLIEYKNIINFSCNKNLRRAVSYHRNQTEIYYSLFFMSLVTSIANIAVNTYTHYDFEKAKRMFFLSKSELEMEDKTIMDIFTILIPKFLKEKIVYNDSYKKFEENLQEDVVIIFLYIDDFPDLLQKGKEKVFEILDQFYRLIDRLCENYGIQKIETVGNNYVACTGIEAYEINLNESIKNIEKNRRMLEFAMNILDMTNSEKNGDELSKLKIKIGIHSGSVISDIIGYHKIQFSLFGKTVNTTSRIASCIEARGSILVSESVYKKIYNLSDKYAFSTLTIKAKGVGDGSIKVYKVEKKNRNNAGLEESGISIQSVRSGIRKKHLTHSPQSPCSKLKDKLRRSITNEKKSPKHQNNFELLRKPSVIKKIDKVAEMLNLVQENSNPFFPEEESKSKSDGKSSHNSKENSFDNEIILEKVDEPEFEELDEINFNKYSLELDKKFPQKKTVMKNFRSERLIKTYHSVKVVFFLLNVFVFMQLLLKYLLVYPNPPSYFAFRIVYLLISLFSNFLLLKRFYVSNVIKTIFTILSTGYLGCLIAEFYLFDINDIEEVRQLILIEIFTFLFLITSLPFYSFVNLIFINVFFGIIIIGLSITYGKILFINVLITIIVILINIFKLYYQYRLFIKSFIFLRSYKQKIAEQEEKISQLLPLHAYEKLHTYSTYKKLVHSDELNDVTLLYADIAGFTNFAEKVSKIEEVVKFLSDLFTAFDKKCVKNKVFKLYTIGDCYVVMGMMNMNKRNPVQEALNVVNMGLEMIEEIRNVRKNNASDDVLDIDMRIGIHSGDIIGGIIGTDVVRYDIFGDDVLITNKIESNGIEGNILISESTKILLEQDPENAINFKEYKELNILHRKIQTYTMENKSSSIFYPGPIRKKNGKRNLNL